MEYADSRLSSLGSLTIDIHHAVILYPAMMGAHAIMALYMHINGPRRAGNVTSRSLALRKSCGLWRRWRWQPGVAYHRYPVHDYLVLSPHGHFSDYCVQGRRWFNDPPGPKFTPKDPDASPKPSKTRQASEMVYGGACNDLLTDKAPYKK